MLDGAPFQKDAATGHVTDRRKTRIYLHDGAVKVLNALRTLPQFEHAHVALASRTEYEEWAHTCLGLLDVAPGVSAADAVSDRRLWQIFPSNKRRHFDRIRQALGDVPYESMIFFDNERSNCTEVSKLGVTCVYTPGGLAWEHFVAGLQDHAALLPRLLLFIYLPNARVSRVWFSCIAMSSNRPT